MTPSWSLALLTDSRRIRHRHRRGGIYFAELILLMPVFLVMLLAVVQFGIFFTRLQVVEFAARVGAEAASESMLNGAVPASVVSAIDEHLSGNGISQCRVIVQYRAAGEPMTATTAGTCPCTPSEFSTPLGSYARVSVCVLQTQLMPNLLAPFGYDITGDDKVVSCSTTMLQE